MRHTTPTRSRTRFRPVRPTGWWFDVLLLAALAGLTVGLADGWFLDADLAIRDWADTHRPDAAYWTARVFNFLGQGGWLLTPLSAGLAIAVGLRTRSVRPLLVVVAAFVLTYLTIGPMKLQLDRGFPGNLDLPHPEELFSDPVGGYAYPSGHVANGIVWYSVIALLLAALLRAYGRPNVQPGVYRAIRVAPPAVVFCTTTYLSFHWLTDSIAGLLLGLLLDRLLARVPWDDVPLPALPGGVDRPGLSAPIR